MTAHVKKIVHFLKTDIWRIQVAKLNNRQSFWITRLRILLLAIRRFDEDKCQLRASALTYYSLLSIVPVMAMAFGIAKGFGFEQRLASLLYERMTGQEEVVNRIITFSQSLLAQTEGGVIAGIGVVFLFWTVVRLLTNIENSLNEIWGVPQGRTLIRKLSDYLSLMLICPLLLVIASSMTLIVTSRVTNFLQEFPLLQTLETPINFLLTLLPLCVMWLLFTFIYVFMPNIKVKARSALIAAIFAGTLYQLAQWAYIVFQIYTTRLSAIYGSFVALPLFLLWLQISWLIVLFGAELSFADQNVETYEFESDCLRASRSLKDRMALQITQLCIAHFQEGKDPLNADQISHHLEAPVRLTHQILYDLTQSGVLSEVMCGNDQPAQYAPANNVDHLTISEILGRMYTRGHDRIPLARSKVSESLHAALDQCFQDFAASKGNIKLKNIAEP